jgi:hypothetical protein
MNAHAPPHTPRREVDSATFLTLYAQAVGDGATPSLLEVPGRDGDRRLPFLMDLDLKINKEESKELKGARLWQSSVSVPFIIEALSDTYREILEIEDDTSLYFTVLARPEGRDTDDGETWKDGLHIESSELWAPAAVHLLARQRVLEHPAVEASRDVLEEAWDTAILNGGLWFLFGSTKGGTEPYDFVSGYGVNSADADAEEYEMDISLRAIQSLGDDASRSTLERVVRNCSIRTEPRDSPA